jgi:hypothetical protein
MRASLAAAIVVAISLSAADAQELSFADLLDTEIRATVVQQRQVRHDGEVRSQRARQELFVAIKSSERIRHTQVVNITNARGTSSKTYSADFTLGEPQKFRDGQVVWVFSNGELRRLRTLETGGQMVVLTFTRTDGKLSCKVSMPFAREEGKGALRTTSTNKGGPAEMLSSKEVSSECHIARK